MVFAASAVCLTLLVRRPRPSRSLLLTPFITFLAGLSVASTVSLIADALSRTRSWGLAIFLSSSGPAILVLSVLLYKAVDRASVQDEGDAGDQSPQTVLPAPG